MIGSDEGGAALSYLTFLSGREFFVHLVSLRFVSNDSKSIISRIE
jgi:hypothetical protein